MVGKKPADCLGDGGDFAGLIKREKKIILCAKFKELRLKLKVHSQILVVIILAVAVSSLGEMRAVAH